MQGPSNFKPNPVDQTSDFLFMYGYFSGNNWSIPYLTMTMDSEDAAEVFTLAADLPEAEQQEWSIGELFQRDVNWNRVDREIVPYILADHNPTFFGGLTIAILPYNNVENEILDSFSDWNGFNAPAANDDLAKTLEIGPMVLGWWNDWEEMTDPGAQFGTIRWNKRQVLAVAIDGQHRLSAFKSIATSAQRPRLRNFRIPVQILIFDESLGFSAPDDADVGDMQLLRRFFIDLNKHAKQVSRTRQILLEDTEPHALCVRKVMAPAISPSCGSLTSDEPNLPLSLVDWHRDSSKFETGPYLTTVITLDWVVAKVIGQKNVSDYMKYDSVRREIRNFQNQLDISLEKSTDRLEACRENESVFSYPEEDLETIASGFSSLWVPQICKIFSTFLPYADLISVRKGNQSFDLAFQHWFHLEDLSHGAGDNRADADLAAWLDQQERKQGGWIKSQLHEVADEIDSLKSEEQTKLAFTVVFQKALFVAWLEFVRFTVTDLKEIELQADDDLGELDLESDEESIDEKPFPEPSEPLSNAENISQRTTQFIDVINRLVEEWPEILNPNCEMPPIEVNCRHGNFWAGALRKVEESNIDYTEAAATRSSQILFVVASMIVFDSLNDPNQNSDFEEFWQTTCYSENKMGFNKRVNTFIQKMISDQAKRILNGLQIDSDNSDFKEIAEFEIKERLRFIWEKLEL